MRTRSRGFVALVASTVSVVIAAGAMVLIGSELRHHKTTATTSTAVQTTVTVTSSSVVPRTAAERQAARVSTVISAFVSGYATYLDGAPATKIVGGSLTAVQDATGGGQIPVVDRDGALHVSSSGALALTCCSAQQTITLSDRQASYPLTVALLKEPGGWRVTSLVPADLSIDDAKPLTGAQGTPTAGRQLARSFAIAYVDYRSGVSVRVPVGATKAVLAAISANSDPLSGMQLPKLPARVLKVAVGPPSGAEFAATITVAVAAQTSTFSLLLARQAGSWMVVAFI